MVYLQRCQELCPSRTDKRRAHLALLTVGENTAPATHTCRGTSPRARNTCPRGPMRPHPRPTASVEVTGSWAAVVLTGWRLGGLWWRRRQRWRARGGALMRTARTGAASQLRDRVPAWSMASCWPLWALEASVADCGVDCVDVKLFEARRRAWERTSCYWPRIR